jgi:uncharacterized protein (TIGR00369 family)
MSNTFTPRDEEFRQKVFSSFDKQMAMKTLGVTLERVEPGFVELVMPYKEEFTQQNGFVHAGILSTPMDTACGYAAFSLMPPKAAVLSIEFKMNLLAPARAAKFRITGQVLKAGRTVTVCQSELYAIDEGEQSKLVAQMTGTMMTVIGREGISP